MAKHENRDLAASQLARSKRSFASTFYLHLPGAFSRAVIAEDNCSAIAASGGLGVGLLPCQ
jgi:hypothetical protein